MRAHFLKILLGVMASFSVTLSNGALSNEGLLGSLNFHFFRHLNFWDIVCGELLFTIHIAQFVAKSTLFNEVLTLIFVLFAYLIRLKLCILVDPNLLVIIGCCEA